MAILREKLPAKSIILLVVVIVLVFLIGLSIQPIMNYFAKKEVASVVEVLNSENEIKNVEQCRLILNFDKSKVSEDNQYFDEKKFDKIYEQCDKNYNLEYVELNEENCRFIIREPNNYFKRNYVRYENISQKKFECSKKFLNPTFST
ncbi:MAG: hypothetical protein LBQ59_01980 [Candidatus Peribacteria bacterium]|jgi:lipopolysaccharide export LptBFGC system permease protein LptF|nr:hypothetical protein [Candidatus Peribacteria bacterium]